MSNFLGQNEKSILWFWSPFFTLTHTRNPQKLSSQGSALKLVPVSVASTLEMRHWAVGASLDPGSHVFSRNTSGFLQWLSLHWSLYFLLVMGINACWLPLFNSNWERMLALQMTQSYCHNCIIKIFRSRNLLNSLFLDGIISASNGELYYSSVCGIECILMLSLDDRCLGTKHGTWIQLSALKHQFYSLGVCCFYQSIHSKSLSLLQLFPWVSSVK